MKILVLYSITERINRSTINEHLFSFKKFGENNDFHYVNIFDSIPNFLLHIKYDAIILHYTFLGWKRFQKESEPWYLKMKNLRYLQGIKIAIPQDEYDGTDRLCDVFKDGKIDIIYTCFTNDKDIEKAYPYSKTGVTKIKKVFTGYINQDIIQELAKILIPFDERPIDIGYRARKLPAYFGRHGQLKYELVNVFNDALSKSDLRTDIQNTNDNFVIENMQVIKLGFAWYDFLINCKAIIGCEGGSSLLDADGSINKKVKEFERANPNASFDEIETNCFPNQDYNISCFALSPRHFEAAMTKTLQILVEGNYSGVFLPWVHYVPLKRDFSNIEDVINVLNNPDLCKSIISNAYKDIVLSGLYSYQMFVSNIYSDIENSINGNYVKYSKSAFKLLNLCFVIRNQTILFSFLILRKMNKLFFDHFSKKKCSNFALSLLKIINQ